MEHIVEHHGRQLHPQRFEKLSRRQFHGLPDGIGVVVGETTGAAPMVQDVVFDGSTWSATASLKWLRDHGFHTAGFKPGVKRITATVEPAKRWKLEVDVVMKKEEQQKVYGWLYVTHRADGSRVVDHSGEIVDIYTLENALHDYVMECRDGGAMHKRDANGDLVVVSQVCEAVAVTPETKAAWGHPGPPVVMNEGAWIAQKVHDPETWLKYKTGQLKMFSFGGFAGRKAL